MCVLQPKTHTHTPQLTFRLALYSAAYFLLVADQSAVLAASLQATAVVKVDRDPLTPGSHQCLGGIETHP